MTPPRSKLFTASERAPPAQSKPLGVGDFVTIQNGATPFKIVATAIESAVLQGADGQRFSEFLADLHRYHGTQRF